MSFSRLPYDSCSYYQKCTENVSTLSYLLDPQKYQHCNQARFELGLTPGNDVSRVRGDLVQLENNLFGIDRPATRCAMYRYMPTDDCKVQGKRQYKTESYDPVNVCQKKHLHPAMMFSYPGVPNVPYKPTPPCPK
jgi:hypothetical protein